MPKQTFHPFPRLPQELRDMVWKLALRSDRPGAHFFRIYSRSDEKRLPNDYAIVPPTRPWDSHRLTAPKWVPRSIDANWNGKFGKGVINSWVCDNPSAYLIDGALWTTCKESRFVMERQFNIEKWKAVQEDRITQDDSEEWLHGEEKMPSTGYLLNDDSTYRYFVVFPNQDLFCIQPYSFETIDYDRISYHSGIGSRYYGFKDLQNVALEFDPAWETLEWSAGHEGMDVVTYFRQNILLWPDFEKLWFIDYNIKRKRPISTKGQATQPDSMVFYGSDCRFVEVARDLSNDYPWEGVLDAQGEGRSSCVKLVDILEEDIEYWKSSPNIKPPKCGVLACEYF
ncbi:hypothetical protein F5Y05DRAFT_422624 [Hypoxylon sp. FL0543]|nr:hypothetical protein F5Y05DRAFT_422624 [Hypoxylon sp. FL0543]